MSPRGPCVNLLTPLALDGVAGYRLVTAACLEQQVEGAHRLLPIPCPGCFRSGSMVVKARASAMLTPPKMRGSPPPVSSLQAGSHWERARGSRGWAEDRSRHRCFHV